jgi:hypothetical protein
MIRKERTGTSAPSRCGIPEAAAYGGGNFLSCVSVEKGSE